LDKLKTLQTNSVAVNKSASHLQKGVKSGDNRIAPQTQLADSQNVQSRIYHDATQSTTNQSSYQTRSQQDKQQKGPRSEIQQILQIKSRFQNGTGKSDLVPP
ncbi:MAG: hypothetical protein EB167_08760, partial [Nitrososphaeria archaeon]|nr:hypothetical protein [Nitrososphaeria archaeon]